MFLQLMLIAMLFPVQPDQEIPKELTGKVVSIADGDTITILTGEKKQVKIRFNGIDAPERGQPFGTKSKEMLSHLVGEKSVRVQTHGEDRYGRTIGDVLVRTPNSAANHPPRPHLARREVKALFVIWRTRSTLNRRSSAQSV